MRSERSAPKSELIRLRRSLKNGTTSAMMNAKIQVTAMMPAHAAQPRTVFE